MKFVSTPKLEPKRHAGEHPRPICKQAQPGLYPMPLYYAETIDEITCKRCRQRLIKEAMKVTRSA